MKKTYDIVLEHIGSRKLDIIRKKQVLPISATGQKFPPSLFHIYSYIFFKGPAEGRLRFGSFSLHWRPSGGLLLFSALWSGCSRFDTFPISILNFNLYMFDAHFIIVNIDCDQINNTKLYMKVKSGQQIITLYKTGESGLGVRQICILFFKVIFLYLSYTLPIISLNLSNPFCSILLFLFLLCFNFLFILILSHFVHILTIFL